VIKIFDKFLEGKGAVITGAASGFGRDIALKYAELGAKLVLNDINEKGLEETVKLVKSKFGTEVLPIKADVSSWDEVDQMRKKAFSSFDNIFVLVNNAGGAVASYKNILARSEEDWHRILDVNLKGQWLMAKAFCRKMKPQKFEPLSGKVINMASIAGVRPEALTPVYSISKAGIIALTRILAEQLAPKMTVNSISPGYHITGLYNNSEQVLKDAMEVGHVKTPLNRLGTVEDVSKVAVFLASPLSDFITGENIVVDGGTIKIGVPAHL
jgi:3-oxoacyl-[acyl-carrier protein] reductase